jgi:hypothetical protein
VIEMRVDRHFRASERDRNGTCTVYVLKEEAMMNSARKNPDAQASSPKLADEGSSVRERRSERPRPQSDPTFSLDQRMESKLIAAMSLLAKLEPQDARARLLNIAVLRRDESLLDGILAELATPPTVSRRSR